MNGAGGVISTGERILIVREDPDFSLPPEMTI